MADELNRPEIKNFIEAFVEEDIGPGGQYEGMQVHTRFPPEPNGYLHIGHCKALCIDFGTAEKFGGICNLRMDDTNPTKEDTEYVEAIKEDIRWLGFTWDDRFYYASQYFDKMYECAEDLIRKGLAYVCELTPEQMREYRGDLTTPARSPYRDRPIEESLDLFRRMKAGEFPNGAMTLRAKIDLASGNFNMRDPAIYRINHMPHHATGDKWCIYPMYDFAHPIEDAMEHITHSLCSLFQSMVTPVSGSMPFSVSRYRRAYSGVEPLPEATMVRPARSAMDWTELPFSTIYSTPRVFTARVTMPQSVRLYSTEARLAGTQAMSSSPCISLGDTSSAEAARVNS